MDDLSRILKHFGVGCYIENVCVCHVFNADDICLLAQCVIALQQLLNICQNYCLIVYLNSMR